METIKEEHKLDSGNQVGATTGHILSTLNRGFKRSKAEQIYRLLRDQESLNSRFKEYDLDDDGAHSRQDDSDNWSIAGSDMSSVEDDDVKPAKKQLKQQKSGRSKTSMGFHNDGGGLGDASSDSDICERRVPEEGRARRSKVKRRTSLTVTSQLRGGNAETYVSEMKQSGETDVASSKSSRPKSSIASFSARSRRQLLASEVCLPVSMSPRADDVEVNKQRKRISSAKGDPLFRRTAVPSFGDSHERRDSLKSDSHPGTPSNLTPRLSSYRMISHTDSVFLESSSSNLSPRFSSSRKAVHGDVVQQDSPTPSNLTPRYSLTRKLSQGDASLDGSAPTNLTPRYSSPRRISQSEGIPLESPMPSNLTPRLSTSRKAMPPDVTSLDKRSIQPRPVVRSTSFAERGKYSERHSRHSRNILSVDSHPLQSQPEAVSSHGGLRRPAPLQASSGDSASIVGARRPMSSSKKTKKYGDMPKPSRTSLNLISDRNHPVTVMKLPPLDSSLKKVVPERDLLCYGKEAMV